MPGRRDDNRIRDFYIENYDGREEVVARLTDEYRLPKGKAHQAAYHPDVYSRWIHVDGTRKDFSVRHRAGKWQIRVRAGRQPRPRG